MELLFTLAHWHALAKLRQHTDQTLSILDSLTTKLGKLLRDFKGKVCSAYDARELARETASRVRRTAVKAPTTAREAKTSPTESSEYTVVRKVISHIERLIWIFQKNRSQENGKKSLISTLTKIIRWETT